MRKVGYNSQRDNFVVKDIKGSSQCFSTCAWMLLSYYAPEMYKFDDDEGLKHYITELTRLNASDAFEWSCHAKLIDKYMRAAGFRGNVIINIDLDTGLGLCSKESLWSALACNPVIIGTKKMSGLPGGHIILGIDNDINGNPIVNDPYGNALTGYKDTNGAGVTYTVSMFDAVNPNGLIRAMWYQL